MRRLVTVPAAVLLLAGPTVLAFFSGGYFDSPRLIAGLGAWSIVLIMALTGRNPLPRSGPGLAVLGGLTFLTVWTLVSLRWAPISSPGSDAVARLLLYLGVLLATLAVLRSLPGLFRAIEPALALGTVVVIGYGVSGRLLPSVIELSRSVSAGGRLEQPITYWNAEGALAAVGFVLCARIAADRSRAGWMRLAAALAWAPLGAGIYLSYSRGALAAAVMGLMVLLAIAPERVQARAVAGALGAGILASGCAALLPGVASLSGDLTARRSDGLIMVAVFGVVAAVTLVGARWAARRERAEGDARPLHIARAMPTVAKAALVLAVGVLVAGGLTEKADRQPEQLKTASAARLANVSSARYDYWRIGLRTFADQPLRGLGAGSFRTAWQRERPTNEDVLEVHSLELEAAAELGLPGLLALAVMLGGAAAAGARAARQGRAVAAGCCAAGTVWLLHASIDWDWQLPAVSLPAVIVAATLIAAIEAAPSGGPAGGSGA